MKLKYIKTTPPPTPTNMFTAHIAWMHGDADGYDETEMNFNTEDEVKEFYKAFKTRPKCWDEGYYDWVMEHIADPGEEVVYDMTSDGEFAQVTEIRFVYYDKDGTKFDVEITGH